MSDEPHGLPEDECLTCPEGLPLHECKKSLRPCGHHCNCSWVHGVCHWCGAEFGEDEDEYVSYPRTSPISFDEDLVIDEHQAHKEAMTCHG